MIALLALALSGVAGGAFAVTTADPPRPLSSGAELPVRPGERVTVSADTTVAADARNGVRVVSPAFVTEGTLRMQDGFVTAVMTVSCSAVPGSHEVRFASPADDENTSKVDRLWGSVRVGSADAAERAECVRRVAELPPESREEHWPDEASWPATPWDVRTVRAGGQMTATDGLAMGSDGMVELSSAAFTRSAVMHGAKIVSATVRIRCDAQPGLYTVHWNEEGKPAKIWARYRVTAAAPGCQDPAVAPQAGAARQTAPWLLGAAAALAAAGAAGYVGLRSRRRTSR